MGESIPWHYHPTTRDDYYVLAGTLRIELQRPGTTISIRVGETYRIEPGRQHTNANGGMERCVFLLIQGPGPAEFVPVLKA